MSSGCPVPSQEMMSSETEIESSDSLLKRLRDLLSNPEDIDKALEITKQLQPDVRDAHKEFSFAMGDSLVRSATM
jgi:hypothetical protein